VYWVGVLLLVGICVCVYAPAWSSPHCWS